MDRTTDHERVLSAYYEEYRALYGLVEFRMAALDRRVPVTAAAFAGAVASIQAVPAGSQVILFVGLPVALLWFTRTTVNHARSFEDVLRRTEEIERAVNRVLGAEVLRFQSRHPSRHRHVGGRTGRESVLAVLVMVQLLLAAAAFQATQGFTTFPPWAWPYLGFLASIAVATCHQVVRLSAYTYIPGPGLAQGGSDRPQADRPETQSAGTRTSTASGESADAFAHVPGPGETTGRDEAAGSTP